MMLSHLESDADARSILLASLLLGLVLYNSDFQTFGLWTALCSYKLVRTLKSF